MYLKDFLTYSIISLFIIIFNSCSANQTIKDNNKANGINSDKENTVQKPIVKSYYSGVIQDNEGIKCFNTKGDSSKLILQVPNDYGPVKSTLSPDDNKLAFSFYDSQKNETRLYVLIINEEKLIWLKNNKGYYRVDFFWDNDSLIISNLYDTKQNTRTKLWDILNGYTQIINVNTNKVIKGFKPPKGEILSDYIQKKYLVYSDYNAYYIIDMQTNKLIKTLNEVKAGERKEITFSPNGKYFFYIEKRKVRDQFGNIHIKNDLIFANYNGENVKTIIDYKFDPQNVKWSPTSDQIVCDIESQQYSNIRHLCFYNVALDKASYNTEEAYGLMPSFTNYSWSPSGKYILVEKEIERQFQTTKNYVIRDITSGSEKYLEYDNGVTIGINYLGAFLRWWSDNILLFGNTISLKVYNSYNNTITSFPTDRRFLFLKEIY